MKNDLKEFINVNIRKYGTTFKNKLGLSTDDLLADVREQVWKGLVTHNPNMKAKVTTWVYKLIDNRFKLLYRRSRITKFNSIDYYPTWTDCPGLDSVYLTTDETSEDLVSKREAMAHVVAELNSLPDKTRASKTRRKHELSVYGFLMKGLSISEMQMKPFERSQNKIVSEYFLSRMEIVRIIKKIHQLVMESQQEAT